ncbi:MAG: rhodanese-like domain-containing protein, partial [Betaproteobacteria bacterium]
MYVERLRELLAGAGELALLDVREQGVHYRGHPFFACSLPLSRLEMMADDLVPRRGAPLVLLDGGGEGLAEKAQARLRELGYGDVAILEGGCAAWQQAGGELFRGVNVPSKAFGELVEHRHQTPRIPAERLKQYLESGKKLVILDSRPFEEYHRMNIPGGIDAPGAELAWRVHDLAPDPATLVVVNCAGRTRSIIGCQSLRNAGIANEVVALKDGTMGWELAGFQVERGAARVAPPPSAEGRKRARAAAQRVAERFAVKFISSGKVQEWQADSGRSLYLLDVRPREEFEAQRIAGSRHAPGGQLVQATDEYLGVRNARIVLVDPERVRSVMTAHWLGQMGWDEAYVLEPEGADGFAGWQTEGGPRRKTVLGLRDWPGVTPEAVDPSAVMLDFSTSLRFRARHIPGAWWAVRSRMNEAHRKLVDAKHLVLTSEDGVLAQLAAPKAAALWRGARVEVLEGGNAAWFAAGRPAEAGVERATPPLDDGGDKPNDHPAANGKHARANRGGEGARVEHVRR